MGACLGVQRQVPDFNEAARGHHYRHVDEMRERAARPTAEDEEARAAAAQARVRAWEVDVPHRPSTEDNPAPAGRILKHQAQFGRASSDTMAEPPTPRGRRASEGAEAPPRRRSEEPDPLARPDQGVALFGYRVGLAEHIVR